MESTEWLSVDYVRSEPVNQTTYSVHVFVFHFLFTDLSSNLKISPDDQLHMLI